MHYFFLNLQLVCFLSLFYGGLCELQTSCQSGKAICCSSGFIPTAFSLTPSVVHLGLSQLDIRSNDHDVRLEVSAQSITPYGFNVHFSSWADSITHSAGVNWLACL
ncbi:unnamed protein product [Adineta ricciae]|uniref:H-type lectin domain-containing protein n=1 Tax=Adineta ricciae TaxID=249248 RepID=A0A815KN94_ADIRI|nr:unnamed protein product [Adineta ricciae]